MIMQDNEKKPALRFKGFTDPWEQRKLGDITVELSEYATQELGLPLLTSSRSGLMYQDEYRDSRTTKSTETLFSVVPVGTCTYRHMSDDDVFHMNINTLEKGLVSREYPVFEASKGNNLEFLVQHINSSEEFKAFCAEQKKGGTRTRLYYNTLCQFTVRVPALKEQAQISQCLKKLDTLITLHQRKYEKLVNIKKSMLDKMFPQNGASVPEIRFKGFTDPWEQRKFGEVVDKYEDPVETPHDGYYRLGIRSHAKGTFHSYVEKGHELETAQMYRVAAGNFIVNITFGWEHAVAITNESDAGKLVSHRFPQYSFHDDMLPEFFKYVIADEDFRHWLWLASPGGAGRNRVLKLDEMLNYEMVLPSKEEQQRIAAIFRNLDTLITLHQRKLEKLQNIKKSCLEKMLV